MRSLIIGMGEIGKAVYEVVSTSHTTRVLDKDGQDTTKDGEGIKVMHICFPHSKKFILQVSDYADHFKPEHIVIWSTVPIGTTKQLRRAVHSPVEGKHPDLEMSIMQMERWIGYNDLDEAYFFTSYFSNLGLRTRIVQNSDFTEALKLLSTTEYGVNLVFADYKAKVAEAIGMDYELTKEWNREYNKLYKNLGMDKRFQKFVLDSPGGGIGGHCVVQNAKVLMDTYPDEILNGIIEREIS